MTDLDEARLAFKRSTRELGLGGPVRIVQTDTDPGDMGEPRIVHDEYGNTFVFVPSYELWPRGGDAAVEVFAEAFEEDPIRLAVATAMAKLAEEVRGLPYSEFAWSNGQVVNLSEVLALIDEATP